MADGRIGLGAIGCGGFGQFALGHFATVSGVRIAAVADADAGLAEATARRFGAEALGVEALVAAPGVDLVYVATPPFLHHRQAMLALGVGRHVICEKPLALDLGHADEMLAEARRHGLLCVTDLMQRYNPLFDAVAAVIEEGLLGEPLHGYFENYAKDEPLPPGHWFWDRDLSGGIFREHAVHFFDIFEGWLGRGRVEAAQRCLRPGSGIEEAVHCTVRYRDAVLVGFYHGFHQPTRLDRQELRLVFERGDVTLGGWIPTTAAVRAIADEPAVARLAELLPGASLTERKTYSADERFCTGRHKELEVSRMVELTAGSTADKAERYGELLRAMLGDQVAWVRDRGHKRVVTERNGRDSLALAVEADRLAHVGTD